MEDNVLIVHDRLKLVFSHDSELKSRSAIKDKQADTNKIHLLSIRLC